jgi:hypothetical protein
MKKTNKQNSTKNLPSCCKPVESSKKSKGLMQGLIYGIIPHAGCIAFILFSVLGVTFAASMFKPLLAKSYFFYAMIALSFIFATISALFYLRKNGGIKTIKHHSGYLYILYGTTIAVSLIMYFLVFPMIAGVSASTGNIVATTNNSQIIRLKVAIPCEGHAPLITSEINKLSGINKIEFNSPNIFKISFNPLTVDKNKILNLDIFNEYKATEIK